MPSEQTASLVTVIGGGVLAGLAFCKTFRSRKTLALDLRDCQAWEGKDGETCFREVLGSTSQESTLEPQPEPQSEGQFITIHHLEAAWKLHHNNGGIGLALFAVESIDVGHSCLFADALPNSMQAEKHARQLLRLEDGAAYLVQDHIKRLLRRFDLDADGALSREEFAVMLRVWGCLSRTAPLSNSSRYSLIRKMCLSAATLAYCTLTCASVVGRSISTLISRGAPSSSAGSTYQDYSSKAFGCFVGGLGLLGIIGTVTSLARLQQEQAVVMCEGDTNALTCVQPRQRILACAQLSVSMGILVSPLWILLDLIQIPGHVHTLWWQFMLAPGVALLGAAGYSALRQITSRKLVPLQEQESGISSAVVEYAGFEDSLCLAMIGVPTSLSLGWLAHLSGARALGNLLIAPSCWMPFVNPSAWTQLGTVDPISLFSDGLYVATVFLYGGLIAYHAAGASARYHKDGDADHLRAALNILTDVVGFAFKVAAMIEYIIALLWTEILETPRRVRDFCLGR